MKRSSPQLRAAAAGLLFLIAHCPWLIAGPERGANLQKSPESIHGYLETLRGDLGKRIQFAARRRNDQRLWAEVRNTLNNALYAEWRSGRLLGDRPEQAYYVHCDRSTMTQNDLDNGRLVVLVGVAPIRPGEFEIIRITENTAAARNRPLEGRRLLIKNSALPPSLRSFFQLRRPGDH